MKRLIVPIIMAAVLVAGCKKTPTEVRVTGISLSDEAVQIVAGKTITLEATLEPSDATETTLLFSSNNLGVATVVSDGLTGTVTAVSPGEATITVSTISGSAFKNCAVTVVSDITNIGSPETANCYIITEPGVFGFKPFKGNSTTLVGNVSSVSVLWETVNSETAPASGTVITEPRYKDGMVAFKVPDNLVPGNALIAALDDKEKILWSWHIWVTGERVGEVTMANNAGIFMDRNVGAIGNTPGDARCNGMMYQWGRKDPFMGCVRYGRPLGRYAATAEPEESVPAGATLTIEYTIAHPTAWGLRDEKNCDWLSTGDYTTDGVRWAQNTAGKTIYDPCPAGWQIPSNSGIWNTAGLGNFFTGDVVYDLENFGIVIGKPYCEPDSWWPAAGELANDGIRGADDYLPGVYGVYWTGATTGMGGGVNNAGRDFMFSLKSKTVHQGNNDYKQFGHPVRCRKVDSND